MSNTVDAGEVYRMPYEGSETSTREAESTLFDLLAPEFDEGTPVEESGSEAEEGDEPDAVEPDEAEEPDGADEADEPDPDEEGEPVEEGEVQTFKVKVDGEEQEVTLDELLRGYSRTADYTRKTQATAEQRKALDAEVAQTRDARSRYTQLITALEQTLEGTEAPKVDWDRLRRENPAEFAAQWAEHQQRDANLQAVRAERARLEEEVQTERQRQLTALLEDERTKLVEAIPEWKEPETAAKEKKALADYAKHAFGFNDQELAQVVDHRVMLLLRKAHQFDQMAVGSQKQLEQKKKAAKVLQPGPRDANPRVARRTAEARKSMDRLAKTGRVQDAAAAFMDLLDD